MYINTRIKSYHHILNADAFKIFMTDKHSFKISNVQSCSFDLSIKANPDESESDLTSRAHSIINYYLVALNIATLGHFSWDFQLVSPVPYFSSNTPGDFDKFIFLHKKSDFEFDEDLLEINGNLIWQSLKIMIALMEEKDEVFIGEYTKGIFGLHYSLFNINFKNESFSSFYRAFEYFCTQRILKIKSLNNEKKQLKSVLIDFGFEKEITDGFDKIYQIRCNDIMHAQKGLNDGVDLDVLLRLKIFLDSILHKYYASKWDPKDR
jgi:hypothetical protein